MDVQRTLTGERFGKLVVIGIARRADNGTKIWFANCDCGTHGFAVNHFDLLSGKITHCPSTICGRPAIETTRGTAIGAGMGIRTADIRSRSAFENQEFKPASEQLQPSRLGEMVAARSIRQPFAVK